MRRPRLYTDTTSPPSQLRSSRVKLRATNQGEGSAGDGVTIHVHDAFRGYT
jgi:hypothetical protein